MSVRLSEILQTIRCTSLSFPSHLAQLRTISAISELPEAFKALTTNHILAMPVVDEEGRAVSVLSAMTLVHHFMNVFTEGYIRGMTRAKNNTFDVYSMRAAQHTVPDEKVRHINELGMLDPMHTLPETATMLDALREMVAHQGHRVVILDEARKPVNMLTQFQMVEFIANMLDLVPAAATTVKDILVGSNPVVTVSEDSIAYDAFKSMVTQKVSSVAVVDSAGQLVGNISSTDISDQRYLRGHNGVHGAFEARRSARWRLSTRPVSWSATSAPPTSR
eukprot:TRINITY_DN9934_c0_g1_i1.p1 TRINITY_DN9934_c0_g1~~TRINITY_DN9934_c0_g1_i1.p1  ORF type:complete len:277 (+),score=64.76 TRINITY_DN9934_c0_g1_i1:85-915(+)